MATSAGIRFIQERLARLRQLERDLRDQFAQSQSNVQRAEEIELMLVTIGTEIAELESTLLSNEPREPKEIS